MGRQEAYEKARKKIEAKKHLRSNGFSLDGGIGPFIRGLEFAFSKEHFIIERREKRYAKKADNK